eukprot:2839869-Alexandrium_andersonii.AAC.1
MFSGASLRAGRRAPRKRLPSAAAEARNAQHPGRQTRRPAPCCGVGACSCRAHVCTLPPAVARRRPTPR